MLIAGLGVGPTMAIFTLIVQNDVPFERLGTATSDLTLLRQIGTSVGPDDGLHALPQQPDRGLHQRLDRAAPGRRAQALAAPAAASIPTS